MRLAAPRPDTPASVRKTQLLAACARLENEKKATLSAIGSQTTALMRHYLDLERMFEAHLDELHLLAGEA